MAAETGFSSQCGAFVCHHDNLLHIFQVILYLLRTISQLFELSHFVNIGWESFCDRGPDR